MHKVLLAKPTPIADDYSDPRWKWFKGCLGALDGTFIDVRVPEHEKGSYCIRKDSRVLQDAIHRPNGLRVPTGNYYLYDNGYANADGFLTPYRGVRYHLQEWDRTAGGSQNKEELFNLKHSLARNVIERTFGLLKVRWGILRSPSFYPIDVQSKIIIACCLLHNFIRNEMPEDPFEHDLPDSREAGFETGPMDVDFFSTSHVNTLDDDDSSQQKRCGNNKDRSGPRRTWTLVEEEALINGLKSLCDLKAEPHLNSKLHVWKRQYSTLCSMMAKSGLGWDDSRNMVTVDDDSAWDEFLKSNNNNCATKRTTSGRKRKADDPCSEIPQLVNMVSNFYETANNRIGSLTRVLESEFGDPNKRCVVMEAVKEISGLEENDVIVVTSKLVHELKNMDIFFSLSMESKAKMVRLILDGRI
ncbi:UNVERIFIED_CONTAM: hypothetical protein Scaly_2154600 [Sesamum calycinum]|uniref:Uncharacterized protein n=1 Tax=Sesamum calycinum TaxID=2727403 RepID=A0AAW2MR20_9LAMI